MKIYLTVLFALQMLSANGLLYLFLFKHGFYLKFWRGLFDGREFLVFPFYNLIQVMPLIVAFIIPGHKAHDFMDHGISGWVYVYSGLIYPLLCLSIIPYKILTRKYSKRTKKIGILLCAFSLVISLITSLAGLDLDIRF